MTDRLTTAPLPLDRAGLFCIVRWQDGINPYIISVLIRCRSPPLRPLERAKRYWNGLWPMERAKRYWNGRRGLVKNHYYTRATHGIVEVMWSNRGAFVERGFLSGVPENLNFWGEEEKRCKSQTRDETFVSEAISDECAAKVLLFFDMAMGWFGLCAVLVRIACMCPNDWAKQENKKHKE